MEEDESVGEIDGLFKRFHFAVLKELSDEDLARLAAYQNDTDRLTFVYSLPCVSKCIKSTMSSNKRIFRPKSASEARDARLRGNKAFQMKNHQQALQLYTAAVVNAPAFHQGDGEPELALALANRSAALLSLGEHKAALDDIEEALENGYPADLQYKLIERQSKCLSATGQINEAIKACHSALEKLEQAHLEPAKAKQVERDVKRLLKELQSSPIAKSSPTDHHGENYPAVVGGKHADFPTASERIAIEQRPETGRFAVAASRINAGDVLVVEKPFASVMNPKKYATHCHHCFRVCKVPVACPTCSRIIFCSRSCRQQALLNYHATECPIIDFLYSAGISITCYLALRMMTIKSHQFYMDVKPFLENPATSPKTSELNYEMRRYLATYNLVTHADCRTPEGFFHVTLMAVFLLKCLRAANYFGCASVDEETQLTDEERWTGSLLLRHVQMLQFNAHEVAELQMASPTSLEGVKSVFMGAAVYPTLSLFNHSCEPGIVRYFIGDTVVVRAIKTIAKGEMIAENYGPIYSLKSREQRRHVLKERYWFDCQCLPCIENWPLDNKIPTDSLKFRCTSKECAKPLLIGTDILNPFVTCPHCKTITNILKSLQVVQLTEQTFNRARELIESGQFPSALNYFIQTLSKLDDVLCPPYQDYLLCQEGARKCMLTMGNIRFIGSSSAPSKS